MTVERGSPNALSPAHSESRTLNCDACVLALISAGPAGKRTMNVYSALKHSFNKLQKGRSTLPSQAKQPGPRSPNSIRPLEVRRNQAAYARQRRPQTLHLQDCGKEWGEMREHLVELEGLDFLANGDIAAVSRLGEKALGSVAQAIAILLRADHLEAASTLIRMCIPSVRLSLLELCEPDHIQKLTASNDAKVRKTMHVALCAATRAAATHQPLDLAQFFKLLSYCSPSAKKHSMALFPSLTTEMLRGLDDQVLVQAVNLTLARIRKENTDSDSSLVEVVSLLSIADKLEGSDVPRAAVMKSTLWDALDPTGVLDSALRSKLEQLRSRIRIPTLTPELLHSISPELRLGVEDVAKMQAADSHNFNEGLAFQPELPYRLDEIDFKAAMRAGELRKAASLIHDSPDEAFRSEASGKLLEAVTLHLYEVGIPVLQGKIESRQGEAAKQQASVARQMAVVLAMTGEASSTRNAETLLSLAPGATIQGVLLDGLGFPDRGDPRSQLRDALPTLCNAAHSTELNFILRTELGKRLVAQAVDDYFLRGQLSDKAFAALFKTLAHRVDLRSTDLFQSISHLMLKAPSLRHPLARRFDDLIRTLEKLELPGKQGLLDECTQELGKWKPGWRVLLLTGLDPTFAQEEGVHALLSARIIDATAADKHDGLAEGIHESAVNERLQNTLKRMMDISVAGKPLLSDVARSNVMSAIVSHTDLLDTTVQWAKNPVRNISADDQVRLYDGMVSALINLHKDFSPAEDQPADRAVMDAAAKLWSVVPVSYREHSETELRNAQTAIEESLKEIRINKNNKVKLGFLLASIDASRKKESAARKDLEIEDKKDELRRRVADLLFDIDSREPGRMKALIDKRAWAKLEQVLKKSRLADQPSGIPMEIEAQVEIRP